MWVGVWHALADGLWLAALPLVFAASAPGAPPSFLLKNDEVLFVLVFAAANTWPMRPIYPLLVTGVPAVAHLALGAWALSDPSLPVSGDWITVRTTAAVHPGSYYANHVVLPLVAGAILALVARAGRSTVERALVSERRSFVLARYFSPEVAAWLGDAPVLERGGVERRIAVLFLDLQGFTTLSERMDPAAVVSLLGEVHDVMVDAVFAERGTLDKFLGDGLMATFGALGDDDALAERAIGAAQRMRRGLLSLNSRRTERGEPPLQMRVGIHLGAAVVGNVGGHGRLEFTSIGDTVNTAARVEAANKELGTDVLVTEAVAECLPPGTCVPREAVTLRGRSQPTLLYTLPPPPSGDPPRRATPAPAPRR